jgi:serine acetyltransferase
MTIDEWREICRQDIAANRGYPKSVVILVGFRTAQLLRSRRGPLARLGYMVVGGLYKLLSEWLLGVELPASCPVGPGLRLRHGVGTVVNPYSVIGSDVMLRHGVTLGNRHAEKDCPVIGDHVEIGAGATLIGSIVVGEHARIGAGAVVVEDVPAYAVAFGPRTVIDPREPPSSLG